MRLIEAEARLYRTQMAPLQPGGRDAMRIAVTELAQDWIPEMIREETDPPCGTAGRSCIWSRFWESAKLFSLPGIDFVVRVKEEGDG